MVGVEICNDGFVIEFKVELLQQWRLELFAKVFLATWLIVLTKLEQLTKLLFILPIRVDPSPHAISCTVLEKLKTYSLSLIFFVCGMLVLGFLSSFSDSSLSLLEATLRVSKVSCSLGESRWRTERDDRSCSLRSCVLYLLLENLFL